MMRIDHIEKYVIGNKIHKIIGALMQARVVKSNQKYLLI